MLTSEVYEEKINVYEIKSTEISCRLNKASNLYLAYMNFICGYLNPYTIYNDDRLSKFQKSNMDKQFTVGRYNKIFRKNTKISDSTVFSNNIYVGQSTKIDNNCNILKSIIGKNCHIGNNVTLKNCIVLDGCKINDNSVFEHCLIEEVSETIKIHNFKS
jgi:NDP-sugar pyrophosphorylase family protein